MISTENGKYVLSICEQKTVEKAKELTHLLEHLRKNNFNTSKVIYTKANESVIVWKEKPIMIKEFIEGGIQKDLPPHLLRLIGGELAKIHQIEAPSYLPNQIAYGKEQFKKVGEYAANSSFHIWLNEVEEYLKPFFNLDLPKSFIHSDLFWNNAIVNEDGNMLTVLDFEEAAYYFRIFDIGMAIIGICGEEETINFKKVSYLLEGYQKEMQLLDMEKKALKAFTIYAGASMTFWRYQNFNYVKPDPKMADHYLGLKVLTDYIWRQADDCFTSLF